MNPLKIILRALILAAALIFQPRVEAQTVLTNKVSCNGSAVVASKDYRLVGVVGQPFIGVVRNSSSINHVGFGYMSTLALTPQIEQTASNNLPTEYFLDQNYPNPFNPTTIIGFALPKQSLVTLKLFDMLGREVATLINGELPVGEHKVSFEATGLPSGIYIYQLQAGSFLQQRKMAVMK
jgi:hypothetical protein